MKFEYRFHEKGKNVTKDDIVTNEVWLDIGNALMSGVIDHHSSGEYCCTVQALVDNLNLVNDLVERDHIVFNTHKNPDTDALFSIVILQHYLQNKCLPENIDSIISYVSLVNCGQIKIIDNQTTLYKMICILGDTYYDGSTLEKCFMLIRTAIRKNIEDHEFSLMESDILDNINDFDAEKEKIRTDYDRYLSDKKERCEKMNIYLPQKGSKTTSNEPVPALIWKVYPTSIFNRLWAYGEGYVLTLVPQENKNYFFDNKITVCTDTIISISPNVGDKYSLQYLSYLLEQYEQEKESMVLGKEHNNKRDHSRPRGKECDGNRFFDKPWSTTSDPWFFTADHTLVQSPSSGSMLTTAEVIKIVEEFGECYVKWYNMNVLIPFTYNPLQYKNILTIFNDKQGWTEEKDIPWLDNRPQYVCTFLNEYSYPVSTNMRHFKIFKNKSQKLLSSDNAYLLNNSCVFDDNCYCILFEFGAGITIFTQKSDINGEHTLSSEKIKELNNIQRNIHNDISENKIKLLCYESIQCLVPHFYTSIEVSSQCLNMSNSLISKYAHLMCDIYDNNSDYNSIENINYRTILAYSRLGVTLVIATDKRGEITNKNEYEYQERFNNEWFYMYLIALQQRYSLIEIKRCFAAHSKIINNNVTKRLREEMINFYATSYFESATDDELGDRIYGKWHEILKIESLKTTIMTQINQYNEYISEMFTAFFDKVSSWFIPVVVFSTIIQMVLSWKNFVNLLKSRDIGSLLEWTAMFTLICVMFAIILWSLRRKKKNE